MARRAEAFDPFGLKGALKDTVEGLMDGLSGDEEPSQEEEQMVVEIFEKFDLDRDGVLNLKEFNELQMTTEGSEALYNADQLKSLLLAVNPDMEKPELGMPFADYRRLYLEGRMRRAYSTDLRKDYQKIFGDRKPVVTAEPVVDTVAVDPPAAAPAPAAPAPAATLAPPVPAGTGAPSGAPSDRTEPMAEVLPNPSVDSEKSGMDVELGENKVERSLSPKKAEDKARSIVDEQATDRGKLMLMVPVLLLVVGLVLTLLLLFLGAMPAAVQTGFDSFMGRNNACQSGEKGRCVSAAPIMHYYMYRVQNDEDYSPENQNMANIPGALWYLHNEIVWHPWLRAGTYAATPKTRIERFLVFSRASQELYDKGMNFGVVNTYDLGKCSGPYKCENLEEYGPVVGCESWNPKAENNFPHGQWTGTNVYPNAVWYSLPGKCSSKKFWKQSGDCGKNEPSGACPLGVVPTGEWTCTYTYQKVGELRISDIENITSLEDLVEGGGREYSRKKDKGKKLHFWDNIHDPKACQKRVEKVKKMFAEKYPDQPVLDDPACDFNVGKFYPYFPAGTFDGPHETNATKNNNANISNATRLLVTCGNQSRAESSPSVI